MKSVASYGRESRNPSVTLDLFFIPSLKATVFDKPGDSRGDSHEKLVQLPKARARSPNARKQFAADAITPAMVDDSAIAD